jgi:predicted transcriptional regulator of viral defense system
MAHVLDILTDIALAHRPFTTAELVGMGMSKMTISRLVSEDRLRRPMRGIYRIPTEVEDPNFIWACISKAYPQSVVCLLSAAVYHGLTESMGGTNIIMIPHASRGYDEWQIEGGAQFIRTRNQRDLEQGIDKITVESTAVSITSPERTIVDLFRFSSYINKTSRGSFAIDPEGIQDAIGRYLDHPDRTPDTKALRAIAKSYDVWDTLSLVIETTQSAKARLSAT